MEEYGKILKESGFYLLVQEYKVSNSMWIKQNEKSCTLFIETDKDENEGLSYKFRNEKEFIEILTKMEKQFKETIKETEGFVSEVEVKYPKYFKRKNQITLETNGEELYTTYRIDMNSDEEIKFLFNMKKKHLEGVWLEAGHELFQQNIEEYLIALFFTSVFQQIYETNQSENFSWENLNVSLYLKTKRNIISISCLKKEKDEIQLKFSANKPSFFDPQQTYSNTGKIEDVLAAFRSFVVTYTKAERLADLF